MTRLNRRLLLGAALVLLVVLLIGAWLWVPTRNALLRGERGVLKISSDALLRLRYNPFYDFLEARVIEWGE